MRLFVDERCPALFSSMEEAVPPEQLESSVGIPVAYCFMVSAAPPGREVEMEVLARAKSDLVDGHKAIFSCARREKARRRTLRALEEKGPHETQLEASGN